MKDIIAKQGMRVIVFSTDQKKKIGIGTIIKVTELYVKYTDDKNKKYEELVSANYPCEIKLDNGEMREGMSCWWLPVERAEQIKYDKTNPLP